MAVETTLGGVRVGLARPLALVVTPLLVAVVGWLVLRTSEAGWVRSRRRWLLFGSRAFLVTVLVVSLAGPYTVQSRTVSEEPSVRLVVDRSASMAVTDNETGELARALEQRGVDVDTTTVGSGTESRVGDAVASSLAPNATVVVASDGQVTGGQSLDEAAELGRQVDATISSVDVRATETERYVDVAGPSKVSAGVNESFLVTVDGTRLNGTETTLEVTVDGETVVERTVTGAESVEFEHTFAETGSHRVTARIDGDDRFARNDVSRKTVRVVQPPRILYVSRDSYPLESFLSELYTVERAESVPSDLDGYYAVVVQDVPAGQLGDQAALQRAVVNGTGLVTVGGPQAFEAGGYGDAPIGDLTPVDYDDRDRQSTVVLAVDVSGSSEQSMAVQRGLALDVLSQLGDQNRVGIVAFNHNPHAIAQPRQLGGSRDVLRDRIRRLQSGGATSIDVGLAGSAAMVDGGDATVVLVTDGHSNREPAVARAEALSERGIEVVTVGVGGNVRERRLAAIARAGGGTYLRASETNRLRLFFGDDQRQYSGDGLTVVDGAHFVTEGVQFTAAPGSANDVSVRDRATYLVASGEGTPAMSAWRYGLGRSVAITAHDGNGRLGGLLTSPDSLAVTRSVNWAVGDPERLATDVTDVSDTRVGERTAITYRGSERPDTDAPSFVRTGPRAYRATVTHDQAGYQTIREATYAVDYPREHAGFGQSPALTAAVQTTGGRTFDADDAAAVAEYARQRSVRERAVEREWGWLFLAAALALFVLEVGARRVQTIRDRRHDS